MSAIRALIVDDVALARERVRLYLADEPDIAVAGEAATGAEAVRLIASLKPDLVFLDVQLPDFDGFEIVRRRLFEPMAGPAQFKDRDLVAREFADFYRAQHQEFPPECRDADYEKRIKAAYPIHPEIFDRLYADWSTLVKFQRTRGVLRLMAAVIHSLWEKGDKTPLILPANISIDDPRVQFELTRYLSDNWVPVIEKDVDGPNSLPLRLDGEVPNLGKFSATP